MLTPKQLKNYDFQSVARNAYKATDVDTFMEEVYKSYEQMFRENAELIKKLNLLADKISHYKAEEESIRNAMVEAQKLKESIVSEAERTATEKITSATEQAQATKEALDKQTSHLITDAQEEAERIITKANTEAEQIMAKTNAAVERSLTLAKENAAKLMHRAQELYNQQVTSIVEEAKAEKKKLQEVKAEAVSVRKKLMDTYQMQLELLQMVPDYQDEVDDTDLAAFAEAAKAEAEEIPEINITFEDIQKEEAPVAEDSLADAPEDIPEDVPETDEVSAEEVAEESEPEEVEPEETLPQPAKKPVRRFFFDLKTKEAPAEPEESEEVDDVSDINDYLDDEED
jgi:cell division septum initiation protein DivIVA